MVSPLLRPGVSAHRPTIVTVLEPTVRAVIEAAASETYAVVHAESLERAMVLARTPNMRAVLLSPGAVSNSQWHGVRRLVADLPGIMPIAVLSSVSQVTPRQLELGAVGVKAVVEVTQRSGYDKLRELLAQAGSPVASKILQRVIPGFGPLTASTRDLLELTVRASPSITSVRVLAARVCVHPTSFVSRFVRKGLPSPKQYLAGFRLIYAAAYLENPAGSVADTAYRLSFASPQSFGRHLRITLGIMPSEFRSRLSFELMLDGFMETLVLPHANTMAYLTRCSDHRSLTPKQCGLTAPSTKSRSIAAARFVPRQSILQIEVLLEAHPSGPVAHRLARAMHSTSGWVCRLRSKSRKVSHRSNRVFTACGTELLQVFCASASTSSNRGGGVRLLTKPHSFAQRRWPYTAKRSPSVMIFGPSWYRICWRATAPRRCALKSRWTSWCIKGNHS